MKPFDFKHSLSYSFPPVSFQKYAIATDMAALINTILNNSSTYAEFAESFVKHIPKDYRRFDIIADCYKTKSITSSEQLSIKRGQSEKIHIASLLSNVLSVFHNSILRNCDNKKTSY